MRPLKLTMSAFGPYSGVETIDFSLLKDKNIFLVTGPTGAGKTTIFDAISYSLFGEASGSSRDKDSLRSDFSSPETPTYVELEFELRGKTYNIRRYPQQEWKKAKGEGFTLKNSDACLTLPNGEIVTKVNSVDQKIDSILGINKNQFRQIVMLPQGEFRKLLEADSLEREVIFRKIFGTEDFEAIQRKLDDQKKALFGVISKSRTERNTHVKNIDSSDDNLLTELINAENLNIVEIVNNTRILVEKDLAYGKKINEELDDVKKNKERLQKNIIEGIEINKKISERDMLKKQYENHISLEKEYEDKQVQLDRARKALEVKVIEDSFNDKQKNLKIKEAEYTQAILSLENCENNLLMCKQQMDKEEARENERKNLSNRIVTFRNYEKKVSEYEQKNSNIVTFREEIKVKEKSLVEQKGNIKNSRLQLDKLNKELAEAQGTQIQREQLEKTIFQKKIIIEDLRSYYRNLKTYMSELEQYNGASRDYEKFEISYRKVKDKYETMEDNFRRGQAGLLARELKEGTICPVCGSANHPHLAQMIDGVPTEDEIKAAKAEFDKNNKLRDENLKRLSDLNGVVNKGKDALLEQKQKLKEILSEEINETEQAEMLKYLAAKGKALGEEHDLLKTKLDLLIKAAENIPNLKDSINKLEIDIRNREELVENLEKDYKDLYGKATGEEEVLRSIENEIPEEIRSSVKLLSKINLLENEYSVLEKQYKNAVDSYSKANNAFATAQANKVSKGKNVEETSAEIRILKDQFENKIRNAGFEGFEQYASLRMTAENIKLLEKNIGEYHQILKSLKDRLEKAQGDTENLKVILIEQLKEQLEIVNLKEKELDAGKMVLFSRIENNQRTLEKIEAINKVIFGDEEKYSVIGELAKIANGDNSERITFERYVLAAYFDEIINAANIRLNKMTGGRFILKRKVEKGKGLKQQGLELEVFDNYTGKARHVRTLSGGESFKVSLSLALGLADVVQAHAGGISLDTMFVDEGFGTLDPESLDNAIQCLLDLQKSGRLVGIISHVPELKERIEVRLEITPAKEGSRACFVI